MTFSSRAALVTVLCGLLSAAPARADIGQWLSDSFDGIEEIPAYLFGGGFEENCPRTTTDVALEGEIASDPNILCAGVEHGLTYEGPLRELMIGSGEVLQWIWVNAAIETRVGEMQAHLTELDALQAATNGDTSSAGAVAALGRMRENVDLLRGIHGRITELQAELDAEHEQMTARRRRPVNDASDMVTPELVRGSNAFREERLVRIRALRAARLELLQQTPLLLESSVASLISGSSRPSDDAFNAGIRNAIGSARAMTQARITRYAGILDEERRLGDEANAIEYENLGADTPGAGEGAGAEGASSSVRGRYSGFILNTLQDADLLRELVATSDPTLIPGCERLVWAGCRLQNRLLGDEAHALARDFAINVALTIGSAGFSAGMAARSASSLARISSATAFAATEITGLALDLSAADAAEERCTTILTSIRSGVSGRVGEYETCLQEASDARAMALISAVGLAGSFGEVVQASRLGRARSTLVADGATPPPSVVPPGSALPVSTGAPATLTTSIWDTARGEYSALSGAQLDQLQATARADLDGLGVSYVEVPGNTMHGSLVPGPDATRTRLLQLRSASAPSTRPWGPLTSAVDHPGLADLISEMDGLGPPPVTICVDPSLSGIRGVQGYFSPRSRVIALRPGASWTTLLHEAQHARFNDRLFRTLHLDVGPVLGTEIVQAQVRLDDAALAQLQAVDPLLADAYRLARSGHTVTGVNETLAVGAELEALAGAGYARWNSTSLRTRLYALDHQISELRAAAATAPLSSIQRSALRAARREQILARTIIGASDHRTALMVAGGGVAATGATGAGLALASDSSESESPADETFGGAQVFYNEARGTYVIRSADGTLRAVSPGSMSEPMPDAELDAYEDSAAPPAP